MENYLALEPLLIDRLKAEVPDFRAVLGMADLAAIMESSQPTPAAHVVYRGDSPVPGNNSAGHGAVQLVAQNWWVVVAARNVRDTLGGADARADAGVLITKTLRALCGWQPSADFRPLIRRFNTTAPGFNAGFAYFPLAFEARLITGAP